MIAITVCLVLFLVVAGYVFAGFLWRRLYYFEPGYDQIHFVETCDGWKIALHRYSPSRNRGPRKYPVVLCHGLGANRFNFDLGPATSLARFLQQEGYDVWVVELRGRGNSSRPRLFNTYRSRIWYFDDYVRKDIPASVAYVQALTGSPKVHWVGHSMGGFALYAYLQGEGAGTIASGTALGSPGFFRPIGGFGFLPRIMKAVSVLPRIHVELLSSGIAPLLARGRFALSRLAVNPDNVDRVALVRAVCFLVSDIHRGELRQFSDWMSNGDFRSFDGRYSYQAHYGRIETPMFFIAGAADGLAGLDSIRFVHERVSSSMKRLVILGRGYGHSCDYGHGDLLIGKACREEVFPLIADWLATVDEKSEADGAGDRATTHRRQGEEAA